MDKRYFTILGHPTGRLLPKCSGYEIDIQCIIAHAKQNRCFFEINSSPDRLDLSAESARLAAMAGIEIAVSTDAHSTHEFDLIRYGIDQARRAGLDKIFRFQLSVLAKTWRANRTYASKHRGPHVKACCPAGVWRSFLLYLGRAILFETPDRECVLALL